MWVVFVGAGGVNGIGSAAGGHIIFLMNNLLGVLRENSDAMGCSVTAIVPHRYYYQLCRQTTDQ